MTLKHDRESVKVMQLQLTLINIPLTQACFESLGEKINKNNNNNNLVLVTTLKMVPNRISTFYGSHEFLYVHS